MTPYYDDGQCVIYHGDCLDLVPVWLDRADVLITDPPYGTDGDARGYGRNRRAIANDKTTEHRDAVLRLWADRPACVFGSPRMPDPPIRVTERLVWDKGRLGMNGGPWRYRHESIYVTDGFTRVDDAACSILRYFPEAQNLHIHAKPVGLMVALIASAPGGVVLDPFMGSGSTIRAAKDCGRKAIGIEIEERYCEIAANRLAQGVLDFGESA